MAKKVKRTRAYLRREDKRKRERRNKILILVVSLTMIFSGIWFFSGSRAPPDTGDILNLGDYVETYEIIEVGNVIVKITGGNNRVVIIPEHGCFNSYIIQEVENLTLPNVVEVSYEVARLDPYSSRGEVCGLFALLNLDLVDNGSNLSAALDSVRGVIGESNVYGSFVGVPVQAVSDVDEVEFIADYSAGVGDYYEISLFQKYSGDQKLGFAGLIRSPVVIGPVVPAEVVGVGDYSITGVPPYNINRKDVNYSGIKSVQVLNPMITIGRPLLNESFTELNNIPGVVAELIGNKTVISFNDSRDALLELLSGENISMTGGTLGLIASNESNITGLMTYLYAMDVHNLTVSRLGFVSVPKVVVISGNLISIENSDYLDSLLSLNTIVGDRINVSLQTITIGGTSYIIGSEEAT